MKDELITFDTAKLAKEKGCTLKLYEDLEYQYEDEYGDTFVCNYVLNENNDRTLSPLQKWLRDGQSFNYEPNENDEMFNVRRKINCSQTTLQRWIREEHKIHIEILLTSNEPYTQFFFRVMKIGEYFTLSHDNLYYDLYEDALEEALNKALKLI